LHPGQAGQRNESELGLDFYVSRFREVCAPEQILRVGYDPALGRFIQPDSIIPDPGSAKGFDRYAYVNNNPVNFNDPSGSGLIRVFAAKYQTLLHTVCQNQHGKPAPPDPFRRRSLRAE